MRERACWVIAVILAASVVAILTHAGSERSLATHPCSGPPFVFGDATDDDRVDAIDALANLRYIAGTGYEFRHTACGTYDVDCNTQWDSVDALKILRYAAGLPYTQTQPCPDIGSDAPGYSGAY